MFLFWGNYLSLCRPSVFTLLPVFIWNSGPFSFREILCLAVTCCPSYTSLLAIRFLPLPLLSQGTPTNTENIALSDSLVSVTHYRSRRTAGWSNQSLLVWKTSQAFVYSKVHIQRHACRYTLTCFISLSFSHRIVTGSSLLWACIPS